MNHELIKRYFNLPYRKQVELDLLETQPVFDVELSAKCNISCVMCPRKELTRRNDVMDLRLVNVLSKWIPDGSEVMLCGMGESLINKNIFSIVSALHKKDVQVGITTNGLLLTENIIDTLLERGINSFQISFNGSTREVYSSIMGGGSFEVVVENLEYLSKVKRSNLTVKLALTVMDQNRGDLGSMKSLCDRLGFELFFRDVHSRGGALTKYSSGFGLQGCRIFPKVTFIAANGDILSCCQDVASKFVLGNICKNTFLDVRNKKREIIETDNWFSICQQCDDEFRYMSCKEHSENLAKFQF